MSLLRNHKEVVRKASFNKQLNHYCKYSRKYSHSFIFTNSLPNDRCQILNLNLNLVKNRAKNKFVMSFFIVMQVVSQCLHQTEQLLLKAKLDKIQILFTCKIPWKEFCPGKVTNIYIGYENISQTKFSSLNQFTGMPELKF